jgi:hypothetical protein
MEHCCRRNDIYPTTMASLSTYTTFRSSILTCNAQTEQFSNELLYQDSRIFDVKVDDGSDTTHFETRSLRFLAACSRMEKMFSQTSGSDDTILHSTSVISSPKSISASIEENDLNRKLMATSKPGYSGSFSVPCVTGLENMSRIFSSDSVVSLADCSGNDVIVDSCGPPCGERRGLVDDVLFLSGLEVPVDTATVSVDSIVHEDIRENSSHEGIVMTSDGAGVSSGVEKEVVNMATHIEGVASMDSRRSTLSSYILARVAAIDSLMPIDTGTARQAGFLVESVINSQPLVSCISAEDLLSQSRSENVFVDTAPATADRMTPLSLLEVPKQADVTENVAVPSSTSKAQGKQGKIGSLGSMRGSRHDPSHDESAGTFTQSHREKIDTPDVDMLEVVALSRFIRNSIQAVKDKRIARRNARTVDAEHAASDDQVKDNRWVMFVAKSTILSSMQTSIPKNRRANNR